MTSPRSASAASSCASARRVDLDAGRRGAPRRSSTRRRERRAAAPAARAAHAARRAAAASPPGARMSRCRWRPSRRRSRVKARSAAASARRSAGSSRAEVGRPLGHLEQLGQPEHVGERRPRPAAAAGAPSARAAVDVGARQLVAHRHPVAPARRHRRPRDRDVDPAALDLRRAPGRAARAPRPRTRAAPRSARRGGAG